MQQRDIRDELIDLVLNDPKHDEKRRLIIEGLKDVLTDEQKKRLEDSEKGK